jgi:pyruvate/2-oxoglutarate dehydrogenase complex dihydrolipoamide acyltransferase (E2) component
MSGLRPLSAACLAIAAGAVAVIVAALLVQSALADGDPASDYLISQQVFVPYQGVSTKIAGEITALLDDSKQKGFPLKVAVISNRSDLGAVPSLFGKAQAYASFLGQEDYYFFKAELLVVMPNGYGLYKHAGLPAGDKAAIKALPAPGTAKGDPLVTAAMHAVRVLARRHGVTLSAPSSSGTGSRTSDRIEIVAGVLAFCALAIGARLLLRRRESR